jgi:hypothetical protein
MLPSSRADIALSAISGGHLPCFRRRSGRVAFFAIFDFERLARGRQGRHPLIRMLYAWAAAAVALSSPLQRPQYGHALSSYNLHGHVTNVDGAWPVASPAAWTRASAGPQGARTSSITMKAASAQDYAVLGLKPGASQSDVKAAYRSLAKKLHPDVNPTDKAQQEFQRLTEVCTYAGARAHERTTPHSIAPPGR